MEKTRDTPDVETKAAESVAVLISGGLDSAILTGEMLRNRVVWPLYVKSGLWWEQAEVAHLVKLLDLMKCSSLEPLQILQMPTEDLQKTHWSHTGQSVPDADSADEAVFIPGKNIMLLGKAMLWCHLNKVPGVALAVLKGNPFPDARPEFFDGFEKAVNQGVGGRVHLIRPYAGLSKTEVMKRGQGMPLEATFSCIQPIDGGHCGCCNKCAERQRAFHNAGMTDLTHYHTRSACTA